jgi:hypothetical protein
MEFTTHLFKNAAVLNKRHVVVLNGILMCLLLGKFNVVRPCNRDSLEHRSEVNTTDSSHYFSPSCLNMEAEPASETLGFNAKLKHKINNVEGK